MNALISYLTPKQKQKKKKKTQTSTPKKNKNKNKEYNNGHKNNNNNGSDDNWILLLRQRNHQYFKSDTEYSTNSNANTTAKKTNTGGSDATDVDLATMDLYSNLDDKHVTYDHYRNPYSHALFFIMRWPGIAAKFPKCVQQGMLWAQTSIPTAAKAADYRPIFVPYPGPGNKDFGGVEKSSKGIACMLDGNAGIWNYHYALGTTKEWCQGIPGPIAHGREYSVDAVELYILDYAHALQTYAERVIVNEDTWIDKNFAMIIACYAFDDTAIFRSSLHRLQCNDTE